MAALMLAACVVDAGEASMGDAPFRRLLTLDPGGLGWAAWGRWALAAGDAPVAGRLLKRAARATPDRPQVWSDYANALQILKSAAAAHAAARAVALAPDAADYLHNLGCERQDADQLDAASGLFSWALRLSPAHAESWARLASCALVRRGPLAAHTFLDVALSLSPALPAALTTRGLAFAWGRSQNGLALRWHTRAVCVAPDFAEALLNRSLVMLETGEIGNGWRDYEWRFASRGLRDDQDAPPRWRGECLTGKKLYIWREQGVGDEILFSSCLPDLAAQTPAGAVTAACDRRLTTLLARSFPQLNFVADGGGFPSGVDYQAPLGALPGLYRRRLQDFSRAGAWLRPDPALTAQWGERLNRLPPGLNVGLAWTSGLITSDRALAYTALADWGALFATPGLNIVNLQYGEREAEIIAAERRFGVAIHRWPDLDLKNDFEALAALAASLDLVICPATAVGELAAAVGTPVWRAAWRDWTQLGAEARPWCGAQRLFSPLPGETMAEVPARIAAKLRRLVPVACAVAPPAGDFDEALRRYQADDLDGAAALCADLLRHRPAPARLRHLAAVIANRRNRPDEAAALLAGVLGGADESPEIVRVLATALKKQAANAAAQGDFAAALVFHHRVLALFPDDAGTMVNAAAALIALRQAAAAKIQLQRGLAIKPDDLAAISNLAHIWDTEGEEKKAMTAYRAVIAADAKNAIAHYNLGLLLLKNGELRDGWAGHDWRFATPGLAGQGLRTAAPLWRGENIAGKTLLIWREQGVGDEIMLASCYQEAIERAGATVIQCDRRLTELFARSFPRAKIIAHDDRLPKYDAHIPAGSLPRRLRAGLERFPQRPAWLKADPARIALWRGRLEKLGPGLKIGLAWRSGLMTVERAAAYIDLADWGPVLNVPGVVFVNLQYGDVTAEIAAVRRRFNIEIAVWDDLDLKNDFENVAALTSCLDLALTPATAAGELAGALGVPVWRLGARDWTQLSCAVRPWLPTMRAWRPAAGERLGDVPVRMALHLRRLAASADDRGAARLAEILLKDARSDFAHGRLDRAGAGFFAALTADPRCAAAWTGVGAVWAELGEIDRARAALSRALALNPADAAALTTLGNGWMAEGMGRRAAAAHERATRVAPHLGPAWDNLGVALLAVGDGQGAEAGHRRALALNGAAPATWANLSAALRQQGLFDAAETALRRALVLDPADEGALANLTRLVRQTKTAPLDDAWMTRARRLAPASPVIAFNHGLALLAAGRLTAGWEGYDQRYLAAELAWAAPVVAAPLWRGEALTGRRLLIWGEQGVGDQILFAGMTPDLLSRAEREGGRVVLVPEARLAPLFRRSFPMAEVCADIAEAMVGGVDFHCGIASLGRRLRRRLGDFPAIPAYLRPAPALCAFWRQRVAGLPAGLRVGLAWRSGLVTGERRLEYTDLPAWSGLSTSPGVQVINLQYGAEAELAAAARQGMVLHGWDDLDLKDDFESVAALVANLDLVISPATSVGELAAAVGTPTWRFALANDWTRLGTAARPWLPAQKIHMPRSGESLSGLARQMIDRLRRLAD